MNLLIIDVLEELLEQDLRSPWFNQPKQSNGRNGPVTSYVIGADDHAEKQGASLVVDESLY